MLSEFQFQSDSGLLMSYDCYVIFGWATADPILLLILFLFLFLLGVIIFKKPKAPLVQIRFRLNLASLNADN